MARQEIILGTAPTGLGGDPPRTASTKINAMTQELYGITNTIKSAAYADVVGTVANGAIIERGSNSSGEFVKFADGTMLTWGGVFVLNLNIIGGGSLEFDIARNQPAAFIPVPVPQHKINFAFFSGADGRGSARYGSTMTFSSPGSGAQRFFGINTGKSPDFDLPSFTVGTLAAQSCLVSFQSIGRWKA